MSTPRYPALYQVNTRVRLSELPWRDLDGRVWGFLDQTGPAVYDRHRDELTRQGLYLDMPAWGYHVFLVSRGE